MIKEEQSCEIFTNCIDKLLEVNSSISIFVTFLEDFLHILLEVLTACVFSFHVKFLQNTI